MNTSPRVAFARLLAIAAILAMQALSAATIQVYPSGSTGSCKLRSAVRAANTDMAYNGCSAGSGADTLVLNQGGNISVFKVVDGASGDPDEDGNFTGDIDVVSTITIQGVNPDQTIIRGPDFDRAFHVLTGGELTLNDVTVIGGSVIGASDNDGGVVRMNSIANLTINRSVLRGGNADYGGAIHASGSGTVTLNKVSIFDNAGVRGGGVSIDLAAGFEAALNNVTISGNIASQSGGGIFAEGNFRLRNSTITNNRAVNSGGIAYFGGNSTGVNFANSILVGNTGNDGDPADLFCGFLVQLGSRAFTMIGALETCSFASTSGNPSSSDARLSPLFDFGSGRPTHALFSGSAAGGAGNPSNSNPLTACLTSDARDVARGAFCDIGSYQRKIDVQVNSFNDFPDLNPGDGVCQAQGNVCTLRAVTMEASASGGRWFVSLPAGTYTLNRDLNPNDDLDGGDIDIKRDNNHFSPLQMTLIGGGEADGTRIVSAVDDRVLEVRGRGLNGFDYVPYPLSFALLNVTLSGGTLEVDPFDLDPNTNVEGGGLKVTGGRTLFYNVVIKGNAIHANPPDDAQGGGVHVDTQTVNSGNSALPYATESRFERFAIIDNSVLQAGGYGAYAGGLWANGATSFDEASDGLTLVNGTIAGNTSGQYAGAATILNAFSASHVSIVGNNSQANSPPPNSQYAGGLTVGGQNNSVRGILLAGNFAGTEPSDCETFEFSSSLVSLGYNLIETTGDSCSISGDTTSNLVNVSAQVGPRQTVAGMPIHSPTPSSPAVDAIPESICDDARGFRVSSDATGAARPSVTGPDCDIGAVEAVEIPIFVDGFDP